jgi:hypothetical protein
VTPPDVLMPTAVHATGELHATPAKAAKVDPGGFGVRTIRQELPSHCSARLAPWPEAWICTPTAMHESGAVHDAQNSWPVGISGLGVGVTDQPGTGGLADAALTEAPAPAAGPSNTTAAPMATAARHIRPRIANPPLPGKSCSLARVTADKPGQQHPAPGGALRGNQGRPAPLRAKRGTQIRSPSMLHLQV